MTNASLVEVGDALRSGPAVVPHRLRADDVDSAAPTPCLADSSENRHRPTNGASAAADDDTNFHNRLGSGGGRGARN